MYSSSSSPFRRLTLLLEHPVSFLFLLLSRMDAEDSNASISDSDYAPLSPVIEDSSDYDTSSDDESESDSDEPRVKEKIKNPDPLTYSVSTDYSNDP